MVILIHGQNEVEVRVKKYPLDQDDYFVEHVKLGEREPRTAPQTRYLIAEDGVNYAIEIVLKQRFNFDGHSRIRATLFHLGVLISVKDWDIPDELGKKERIKEDATFYLEANDPILNGKIIKGARFAFQTLNIDQRYHLPLQLF